MFTPQPAKSVFLNFNNILFNFQQQGFVIIQITQVSQAKPQSSTFVFNSFHLTDSLLARWLLEKILRKASIKEQRSAFLLLKAKRCAHVQSVELQVEEAVSSTVSSWEWNSAPLYLYVCVCLSGWGSLGERKGLDSWS